MELSFHRQNFSSFCTPCLLQPVYDLWLCLLLHDVLDNITLQINFHLTVPKSVPGNTSWPYLISYYLHHEDMFSPLTVWLVGWLVYCCLFVGSRVMLELLNEFLRNLVEGWDRGRERTKSILTWIQTKGQIEDLFYFAFFNIALQCLFSFLYGSFAIIIQNE